MLRNEKKLKKLGETYVHFWMLSGQKNKQKNKESVAKAAEQQNSRQTREPFPVYFL